MVNLVLFAVLSFYSFMSAGVVDSCFRVGVILYFKELVEIVSRNY